MEVKLLKNSPVARNGEPVSVPVRDSEYKYRDAEREQIRCKRLQQAFLPIQQLYERMGLIGAHFLS